MEILKNVELETYSLWPFLHSGGRNVFCALLYLRLLKSEGDAEGFLVMVGNVVVSRNAGALFQVMQYSKVIGLTYEVKSLICHVIHWKQLHQIKSAREKCWQKAK